jgi:hypothetical protein
MSPFAASRLPQIESFTSGLITNRNAISTPFTHTVTGAKIHAWDVLIDGLNMEQSAYGTLQRRPGWVPFSSNQAVDTWQYKDLNGVITLYQDTGFRRDKGT